MAAAAVELLVVMALKAAAVVDWAAAVMDQLQMAEPAIVEEKTLAAAAVAQITQILLLVKVAPAS
jgi:hypothetical protein